ncbi:MAG: hypothetical protein A2W85_12285 [Bacteroidetes bacterium GWF2_41_31]|nr:MAG: hypothetical protein A2W85_12285 [Bacteroidetes bacterium GWF2_41_31]
MKIILISLAMTLCQMCLAQNADKVWSQTTMVNDVIYKDSIFNKTKVGCGFLLKYKNDTFAITAKHIMNLAKTDDMITTNFEGGLKEWRMYPKDKPEQTVIMGKLLNEDTTDTLTWEYLEKAVKAALYNDFLIFTIKENNSNITPLELSKTAPQKGDILYDIGWTYNDTVGPQRVYKCSFYESTGISFNMRKITYPENGVGLSGSPVINSDGLLVGILSRAETDPVTKEVFASPQHINYLTRFFEDYYKVK